MMFIKNINIFLCIILPFSRGSHSVIIYLSHCNLNTRWFSLRLLVNPPNISAIFYFILITINLLNGIGKHNFYIVHLFSLNEYFSIVSSETLSLLYPQHIIISLSLILQIAP